jgi:hypothetical protein
MNFLKDLSNIVLYSLFLLDAAYAFVIHNKGSYLVKSIKKSSSEKELHALTIGRSQELKPIKPIKYIESIEYLDDGEVPWEIPVKIFESDESGGSGADATSSIDVEYNLNPYYSILSGVVKGLNKEIFRLDTVYDILVTWKTQTYVSNILLLLFATLLKYTNSLIVQGEVDAIKKNYNETKNIEYMEKYIKIRRYTSTIILLGAFILTKNVQIAE